MYSIPLYPHYFMSEENIILQSQQFTVSASCYPNNIATLTIKNKRGYIEILPFMGQMIWDAKFDNVSLRMDNMFSQPQHGKTIVDTYGCFAFHSGLLSNGCPTVNDNHPLHGEFPCARMDKAWLEISEESIRIVSEYEYVQGFGHHYLAKPSVTLKANEARFDIDMAVTNLSNYQPMPLMYMCHINYAYVENGVMSQNIPNEALQLRQSIPAHVKPTPEWEEFNKDILNGKIDANVLNKPQCYDPEIVYFADNLQQYADDLEFELTDPQQAVTFSTKFASNEFPNATRWILHNPDQKVAAFVLPATARPEGYLAAEKANTLQWLAAGETKSFHLNTGIKE
ncbi:aldose 1-epimerase family protein [Pasteurella skyensis]|uniref:Aldose 1-epimerase family protein n=1 Tax=Phocoenobacter skyensis TaxID=97481 RepID=A0AAJ6NAV8_9PAST|nr:aldose 1-epimerase family protein [Pasteurella skyensis]MDP8161548.1 aldose 1-epimerase family protein [Pasteurella skyensis]MDP8173382.1 aldose 1-epimerase family protein [Pasteurella skyensis]MDP8175942.1 aldose 1-epimerase family protein [Pasteurella skyensis]MDP8177910.1 aldose 1-epimerase family protein [Pasteurella skyensis]MDP8182431.1 aldose 1-epimerase family protein [Pasteurella skyensis]